ncbi:MAG: AzlC family ABC transporter permease [Deltaproteobacteria bacterium]|nr:AzlC family ABC transporter permease [Deltaproteobacteria bacterium]
MNPSPSALNNGLKKAIRQGLWAAWPICIGYVPIGLALGLLAQKAGLSPLEIGLMSVFVFAGSAQFIAVSMISGGSMPLAIIMTTFVVNLRHLLMSSSLSLYCRNVGKATLAIFAYGITDESFAVNQPRFKEGKWTISQALTVNQTSNLVWILSTIAGGYGGRFIPPHAFGVDYALIAMFICLLIFQIKGLIYVITAVIAGCAAVALSLIIPGNLYVVIASVLAATIGLWVRIRINKTEKLKEKCAL